LSGASGQERLSSSSVFNAAKFVEVSRLNRAFGRIGDPAFRATVIELAESWQK
jgi:hypothetical protein